MRQLKALFFDQDGTIVDTEKDGHRVAFNHAFKEFGFTFEWDVETYRELLQIAGGKERMRAYLHETGFGRPVAPKEEDELIKALHKRKTDILVEMLSSGSLPLRPGIERLMREAQDAGVQIAICTTSNEKTAQIISETLLKGIHMSFILAGDIVSKKKPDPEIYHLALKHSGLTPADCFVIEDSKNGVDSAVAAGIGVVATTNVYTENEELGSADIVLNSLGDNSQKARISSGGEGLDFRGELSLDHIETLLSKRVRRAN